MKRIIIFLLACLQINISANSQKASINNGEEDKTKLTTDYFFTKGKGTDVIRLSLVSRKHGIGGFAKYSKSPTIYAYNKKMEVIKENELPELDVNTSFDTMFSMGNKILLFTNRYDKDSKSTYFNCQAVNISSLQPEGNNLPLGKFETANLKAMEDHNENGNNIDLRPAYISKFKQQVANYFRSTDSSKLLVAVSAPRAVKENEKYYVVVYDINMNKTWEKTIELPYQSKFIDLQSMHVINNGSIAAVIRKYEPLNSNERVKKGGEKITPYITQLILFNKENALPTTYPIDLSGNLVHSVTLSENKEGQLSIFGLYSLETDGNIQGFFNALLPGDVQQKPLIQQTAFASDLVDQIISEKQASKKGSTGIGKEYNITRLIHRENSSTDYILEYHSQDYNTTMSNNPTFGGQSFSTRGYYIYGNLIDINVNNTNGKIIVTKIPRYQIFPDLNMFGGFQAIVENDKLLLLFNDDEANISKKANESPRIAKLAYTTALQLVVIDGIGVQKRTLVINPESGRRIDIKNSIPLNKNTIAIHSYSNFLGGNSKIMPGIITIK